MLSNKNAGLHECEKNHFFNDFVEFNRVKVQALNQTLPTEAATCFLVMRSGCRVTHNSWWALTLDSSVCYFSEVR